ncbi:hypothetical protein CY658_22745 [Variovorax sp. RO1]|uniref:hypothetical protein n=1 Tax=Variovorax sp. RO1 TaxID=2066034 RepID=UPI000C717B04|nr:hypothetical protein [Variovorax sp. RO1]PLC03620.1 hypothetical protein CY658_22745 [Variovorax sp. RO1]
MGMRVGVAHDDAMHGPQQNVRPAPFLEIPALIAASRTFVALATLFIAAHAMPSHAAEPRWFVMSRESGCVPLAELREVFPSLTDRSTPREVFEALRRQHPDSRLITFRQALAEEARQTGKQPSPESAMAYRLFNDSNAFVVSSQKAGRDTVLLTEALCRTAGILEGK